MLRLEFSSVLFSLRQKGVKLWAKTSKARNVEKVFIKEKTVCTVQDLLTDSDNGTRSIFRHFPKRATGLKTANTLTNTTMFLFLQI